MQKEVNQVGPDVKNYFLDESDKLSALFSQVTSTEAISVQLWFPPIGGVDGSLHPLVRKDFAS